MFRLRRQKYTVHNETAVEFSFSDIFQNILYTLSQKLFSSNPIKPELLAFFHPIDDYSEVTMGAHQMFLTESSLEFDFLF